MIVDPSDLLQAKISAVLKAAGTIAADRIYCPVPAGAVFPYVSLGEFQVINEKFEGLRGASVSITIHGWSRAATKVEIRALGKQVAAALDDADLSDGDLVVNSCLLEHTQYLDDPDGKTAHAALTFAILTD